LNKSLFYYGVGVLLIISCITGCVFDYFDYHNLSISNKYSVVNLKVEIAKTLDELSRGLMFRKKLESNKGMLFLYNESRVVSFWMKNTLIPLDMLFIDEDWRIEYIEKNVPPCPDGHVCQKYGPKEKIKYVLEVVGGYSDEKGIKEGDRVEFKL